MNPHRHQNPEVQSRQTSNRCDLPDVRKDEIVQPRMKIKDEVAERFTDMGKNKTFNKERHCQTTNIKKEENACKLGYQKVVRQPCTRLANHGRREAQAPRQILPDTPDDSNGDSRSGNAGSENHDRLAGRPHYMDGGERDIPPDIRKGSSRQ